MSGSPAAAQAHHWWPRVQKKCRMELLLHLSSVIQEKHSLIDPYMAPVASLRFQHGRCCWVLNQPQCDTSVKEVLHTRWAFKYSFLCSNVTVLIINTADARWSVVDFINNLKNKAKETENVQDGPLSLVFYQRLQICVLEQIHCGHYKSRNLHRTCSYERICKVALKFYISFYAFSKLCLLNVVVWNVCFQFQGLP